MESVTAVVEGRKSDEDEDEGGKGPSPGSAFIATINYLKFSSLDACHLTPRIRVYNGFRPR